MNNDAGIQITFIQPAPPTNGTPTSNEAAALIVTSAATLRGKVLNFVTACGDYGATDEEIQLALEMNPSTQRPRRGELEKAGLIVRTTKTRLTSSGRKAIVFVAVKQVNA